jgi:flavin reductase (DIM6/NTAB) family NADH-FMN oxidoreductase RutF
LDDDVKPLYRRALGAYATGVAVVTVPDGDDAAALTINSFTSISLDPPLVLWALGNASDRGAWFREADRFVINVLGAEDEDLARDCARRGHYRLPEGRLDRARPGEPTVTRALTRLFCRVYERVPMGDHVMIVGEVLHFETRGGDGLTYFRGRYGRAAEPENG